MVKNWIDNDDYGSLILGSKVCLSRNLKGIKFPNKLDIDKARDIVNTVVEGFYESVDLKDKYKAYNLWELSKLQSMSAFERQLISINMINASDKTAVISSNDETISVMINDQDHLRLQCIGAGICLKEAYETVNELDNKLEDNLDFAFDEKIGYITSSPTNLGTGMRASVMLHLPALSNNDDMEGIFKALSQVGMNIRVIYGEDSKGYGNIYELYNQTTLGVTEEDILNNVQAAAVQVVNQEIDLRNNVIRQYDVEIADKICRSLGILKNARMLQPREALDLMSNVRMGIEMGLIKEENIKWNTMIMNIQQASIQLKCSREMTSRESAIERAAIIRKGLS